MRILDYKIFSNNISFAFIGEIAAKLSPLATYWAVAKFLSPEDFGIYSTFLIIVAGCALIWEGGFAKAVIKLEDGQGLVASNAFIINQGLAIILSSLFLVFPGFFSSFFLGSSQFILEMQLAAIYIILSALSSIPICLLQRDAKFGRIAKIRFVVAVVPIIVTLPLVICTELKHFALIYGLLASLVVQLFMLVKLTEWRPKLILSKSITVKLFNFSKWVILSSIAAWIFAWGDSIFVVKLLTVEDLGLFRMASHLVLMGYMLIFSPLNPLLYSRLVKFKNYNDSYLVQLLTIASLGAAIILTISFALIVPLVLSIINSDSWQGLASLVIMASLTQIIPFIFVFMGEFYRAAGIPRIETLQRFTSVIALITFFIFCSATTLNSFMEQRLILTFITGILELTFIFWFLKHIPTYTLIALLSSITFISMYLFLNLNIFIFFIPIIFIFVIMTKRYKKLGFLLN